MRLLLIKQFLMPNRPKKIKRSWLPDRKPFGRRVDNSSFYNSIRWRKVSKLQKIKNPLCVECEGKGIVSRAEFTDHILRIEDGGAKFDAENLQSLCAFHHNSKSGKEAHGFKGANGVKSQKK
jgi:5-methylcytosine-specific restriction endonuclease McrA